MSQFRTKITKIGIRQRYEQSRTLDRSEVLRKAMGLSPNELKLAHDMQITWRTLRHVLAVKHTAMSGEWHYYVVATDFLGNIPDDDRMQALLEEIADYYEFDDEQN